MTIFVKYYNFDSIKTLQKVYLEKVKFKKLSLTRVKVVVAPKISLWKKKFFYDFKTGNYIISRVICKKRHSF